MTFLRHFDLDGFAVNFFCYIVTKDTELHGYFNIF